MLAHLALATALFLVATHMAPSLLDSRVHGSDSATGAVILTAPAPDAKVREPRPCPPAIAQPIYRDLSHMTLIPAAPRTAPAHPATPL